MKASAKSEAFWSGRWGLTFGSALFLIPDIGPVHAAGPLVGWVVVVSERAVIAGDVSALGAVLSTVAYCNVGPPRSGLDKTGHTVGPPGSTRPTEYGSFAHRARHL